MHKVNKMGHLWLKRMNVIAIYLMMLCTTMTNAQIRSNDHQEQGDQHLTDADNIGKDTSRLQTIEGKVKSPSPKVIK